MSFWDSLQQASYNGIPFGIDATAGRFGRRVAMHEYPYRDKPWPEDMGQRAREHRITGFLLENDAVYGGGPVIEQLLDLRSVVEVAGPGQLVHPTLGTLQVSVIDFEAVQRKEEGLVYELHFLFVEGGLQIYPDVATSTQDAVLTAASAADAAASTDFLTRAGAALKQGAAVVKQAVATASLWAARAQALVNDARNVYKFACSLKGAYGRYFNGRLSGFNPSAALQTIQQTGTTVTTLIAQGTVLRNRVVSAGTDLINAASQLGL
ncbi:DNA circularization N-terminal domain-containing protein [Paraburkholderia terrae]|uniref:DNA circularization N-terminal domain-containing protein n=1 Tax=Paraburkholderia terrae TaxID=311230 RepID=UPI00296ABA86|nr:DNA circularization N-terminal domain-containing protein [Paraburkholderia terrae]MDW3655472.1 DNA circularization N-terminal domain-containing protein [Paraburkholderia terrae]